MRRVLAAVLAVSLACAAPRTAEAQVDSVGEAIGFIFLFTLDTLASIGGTVTGIGSGVQLGRHPPAIGWSIASIVVGTLAGLAGAITIASLVASDIDEDAPGLYLFAGIPLALCATNLTIGVINLTRSGARKPKRIELEEEYEDVIEEEDE
jgi:hypothetical protein